MIIKQLKSTKGTRDSDLRDALTRYYCFKEKEICYNHHISKQYFYSMSRCLFYDEYSAKLSSSDTQAKTRR